MAMDTRNSGDKSALWEVKNPYTPLLLLPPQHRGYHHSCMPIKVNLWGSCHIHPNLSTLPLSNKFKQILSNNYRDPSPNFFKATLELLCLVTFCLNYFIALCFMLLIIQGKMKIHTFYYKAQYSCLNIYQDMAMLIHTRFCLFLIPPSNSLLLLV